MLFVLMPLIAYSKDRFSMRARNWCTVNSLKLLACFVPQQAALRCRPILVCGHMSNIAPAATFPSMA
eukprot:scaffold276426_cov17-Tisochrysis_lutea.AAC.1